MPALRTSGVAGVMLGLAMLVCSGCDRNGNSVASADEPGGAELWAHKCRKCHNLRPPNSFTPDQWEVVVSHMRVRARLSDADARKIEQFLKTAAN